MFDMNPNYSKRRRYCPFLTEETAAARIEKQNQSSGLQGVNGEQKIFFLGGVLVAKKQEFTSADAT